MIDEKCYLLNRLQDCVDAILKSHKYEKEVMMYLWYIYHFFFLGGFISGKK